MANIRKSFNFRNGLQVDNDGFVVTPNGNVGIGTSLPSVYKLSVYGDANITGFATVANLYSSGIGTFGSDVKIGSAITAFESTGNFHATAFYGDGSTLDNIVGYSTQAWLIHDADGSSANSRTGISTTSKVGLGTDLALLKYDLIIGQDPLVVGKEGISFDGTSGNIYSSGIVTATKISGTLNASFLEGTISNDRFNTEIGTENTTFFKGTLVGIATNARGLTGTPNITVGTVNSSNLVSTSSTVGHSTVTGSLHLYDSAKLGIGTVIPSNVELLVSRNTENATLSVVSSGSFGRISVGNSFPTSSNVGDSVGYLKYQNKNLQVVNQDTGNLEFVLHNRSAGVADTGKFLWTYGNGGANTNLLALTYNGNFGVGEENPTHKLHVGGASTFTAAAYFESSVTIDGALTFGPSGSITLPSELDVIINSTTGMSTFTDVSVGSTIKFGSYLVTDTGSIGIGTTSPITNLDARQTSALFNSVGVGTDSPVLGVDFSHVGMDRRSFTLTLNKTHSFAVGNEISQVGNTDTVGFIDTEQNGSNTVIVSRVRGDFITSGNGGGVLTINNQSNNNIEITDIEATGMSIGVVLPSVTAIERVGISTVAGTIIFDSSDNTFKGYDGTTWQSLH